MVSAPPKREFEFREKKLKYGSFYGNRINVSSFQAFHGSSIGNWHCILREGLKNYSGTSKMR
jgi:hypothetical protein